MHIDMKVIQLDMVLQVMADMRDKKKLIRKEIYDILVVSHQSSVVS